MESAPSSLSWTPAPYVGPGKGEENRGPLSQVDSFLVEALEIPRHRLTAADIMLWKCWGVSIVVIVVATVAWLVFERSGLPFLTISSDMLLILIILHFIWANSAGMLNTSLRPLPELVLSEEMVNNAAASFRVKVNNMLLVAHDIAHGKDFRSFFQVVIFLWLISVMGSFFSFFTLTYIGTILLMIVPALYNKYEERVDRYAGLVHQSFRKHYRIVDENVLRRLPSRRIPRDKTD